MFYRVFGSGVALGLRDSSSFGFRNVQLQSPQPPIPHVSAGSAIPRENCKLCFIPGRTTALNPEP